VKNLGATILLLGWCGIAAGCRTGTQTPSQYIARQSKLIQEHKQLLVKAGRVTDPDHFPAELYLANYAWHTHGDGMFGTYTFYQPAFEQAKKLYVIHGEMLAGTDILVDTSWGECIEEKYGGCIIGSSDGYASPRKPGAFDAAVVGYFVGTLTYCMKYGAHYEHCGDLDGDAGFTEPAKVVEFIDGGHVRLDHKAKYDAEMYGLVIAPPDYVDMCECSATVQNIHADTPPAEPAKPCVQGGTLQPGESCSVGVVIPTGRLGQAAPSAH
jgi:hypothetical protein